MTDDGQPATVLCATFGPLRQRLRESWRLFRARSPALKAFHLGSPLGRLIERAFGMAQFLSPATVLWGTRAFSHRLSSPRREHFETWRSRKVDCYIFVWLIMLLGAHLLATVAAGRWVTWLVCAAGAARGIDIVQANVNMHLLDGLRLSGRSHHVASLVRSSLISVWNYLELVGWYALAYFFSKGLRGDSCGEVGLFESVYFSTITQLTIGFGDLKPATALARLLTMSQGLLGTLFLVFAISRFASLLPRVGEHRR